jgi:voltage-gated potassium channel
VPHYVERRLNRFLSGPESIRNAIGVITAGTTTITLIAAFVMWTVDREEYPNIGRALWWAVQTVTTVGYGDVAPHHFSGRLVAAVLMLWGVAFIAILTAVITSTFVGRRAREAGIEREIVATFSARLDRIEELLAERKEP